MRDERVTSVGIDIGTTTMSLVVSAIAIGNTVYGFGVPNIRILEKEVLFKGKVRYTPFLEEGAIDQRGVEQYIAEQLKAAGVKPSDVKTGAVIITGRAAEAENAKLVGNAISRISGEFVVAAAGAHLEAAISGRGAGMAKISSKRKCRTLNLDIGGGTTNAAFFDNGLLDRTFCFDIGGRILRFSPGTRIISHFSPNAYKLAERRGISLRKGLELTDSEVKAISDDLAGALFSFVLGEADNLAVDLSIDNRFDIPARSADLVSFSGGVGRLFYDAAAGGNVFSFGDLGPSLALALCRQATDSGLQIIKPEETLYATVIGAGAHTVNISGSTIYISNTNDLPLRDNPVVSLGDPSLPGWRHNMMLKLETFSETIGRLPVFFIEKMNKISFSDTKSLAESIAELVNDSILKGPLIVISDDDIGKIIGGLLRNRISPGLSVISVDELSAEEMDYVDIGEPLYGGSVVPVVVKTLVFPN